MAKRKGMVLEERIWNADRSYYSTAKSFISIQNVYNFVVKNVPSAEEKIRKDGFICVKCGDNISGEFLDDYKDWENAYDLSQLGISKFSDIEYVGTGLDGLSAIALTDVYGYAYDSAHLVNNLIVYDNGYNTLSMEPVWNLEEHLNAEFKDFLEKPYASHWRYIELPKVFIQALYDIYNAIYPDNPRSNGVADVVEEYVGKFFMRGSDLVFGIVDMVGESSEYTEYVYGENTSVDVHIEKLISIIDKLGKPVQDIYWLMQSSNLQDLRIRKNSNGEYTMVVY